MIHGKLNIEIELMTIGTYDALQSTEWKERAGRGEWGHEPFDFGVWVDNATGLTCAIKRNHGGAWCGYVFVEEDHPINQRDASDDEYRTDLTSGNPAWLNVHGGVTWHDTMSVPDGLADGMAVGFDCAHYGDLIPGYSVERNHPDPMSSRRDGTYRTASYVIDEVRSLAKQIMAYRPLHQLAV